MTSDFQKMKRFLLPITAFLLLLPTAFVQSQTHYDESKVPGYTLPNLLALPNGKPVRNVKQWEKKARGPLLQLFAEQMFGITPERSLPVTFTVFEETEKALEGKAIRRQVAAVFRKGGDSLRMDILIYLPLAAKDKAVPLFVGMNFYGNHTIWPDPAIRLNTNWMRESEAFKIVDNRATEASRGLRPNRWPVQMILERGYGLATIYCGDLDPDKPDFSDGLHPFFYADEKPAPDQMATIGAWAWGLSRAMDFFEKDPQIDHGKVAVMGHSRLGKTSLWAGAQDERFALVISNNSGCGGAALSRRAFGETLAVINERFPHWFCGNFDQYSSNEQALPFDQHQLLALIAPRPVYVASASKDLWADPKGEFLALKAAGKLYGLYGFPNWEQAQMPSVGEHLHQGRMGYHLRQGKHDVTDFDWKHYLDFADRFLKK